MSVNGDYGEEVLVQPPAHPVPTLQGPFEESMVESVSEASEWDEPLDAVTRRTVLLDSPYYQRVVAGRWKQKPGEKYHPLWKLVAQMSFGLHLLARKLAKSEDEVMKILQAHVDDIDGFLERTTEDFVLAQSDMYERLKCLKLPLQHGEVFDRMLEERTFRASILEGNEKIEHIISRTKRSLKDALKDVQKGFDATNVLDKYIADLALTWERETPEHEAVFVAMLGNAEGWRRAFMELHLQGNKLAGTMKKLSGVVAEMERRAAIASRNQFATSQTMTQPSLQSPASAGAKASTSRESQIHKPLPQAPSRTRPTRSSSRTVQPLEDTTRPDTAQRSSGRSSRSRPESRGSTQLLSGQQTPNTTLRTVLQASQRSSTDMAKNQGGEKLIDREVTVPVELPADVPEEVLRNAPVSIKNRLSMTLGLKPKDNADHRISSIYYPRALGDLLKIPPSPRLMLSPKQTVARAVTPATDSDTDYFSAQERSPSMILVSPRDTKDFDSNVTTPEKSASNNGESEAQAQQGGESGALPKIGTPALNSHPSVMMMASPPTELPVSMGDGVSGGPRTRQSSLGEPGPEVTESEADRAGCLQSEVPVSFTPSVKVNLPVNESSLPRTKGAAGQTVPAIHERHSEPVELDAGHVMQAAAVQLTSAAESGEGQQAATGSQTLIAMPDGADLGKTEATVLKAQGADEPKTESRAVTGHDVTDAAATQPAGEKVSFPGDTSTEPEQPSVPTKINASSDHSSVHISENTKQAKSQEGRRQRDLDQTPAFAELEAIPATNPPNQMPTSPIELEAPMQHFVLPPRPMQQAQETKSLGKDGPQAAIKEQADFFKLPTEQYVAAPMKPRDFRLSSLPEPIRPLRLQMKKVANKLVPVQKAGPGDGDYGEPKRLSGDVIASIIEQMAITPAGSPDPERPNSASLPHSTQKKASDALAPPHSAPVPPGPSGRPMVHPDYANAGMFNGERRASKETKLHSSAGSKGGLRDLLSGRTSRRNSSDTSSTKTTRQSSGRQSTSGRGSGSDMLTSGGKDVLWFKNQQDNIGPGQQVVGVNTN